MSESENIEFKSSFGKETIITLSAFANTSGGTVIIGLNDKGKVIGTEVNKETAQKYINEIKNSTYPQLIPNIDIKQLNGENIILINIAEFPIKPVAYKNRYYKRVENSNHNLSLDEIVNMRIQSLNISYDSYPVKQSLTVLNNKLMVDFFNKINSKGRISLEEDLITNLIKLKLIKENKPALAALLLFGKSNYSIHSENLKSSMPNLTKTP